MFIIPDRRVNVYVIQEILHQELQNTHIKYKLRHYGTFHLL